MTNRTVHEITLNLYSGSDLVKKKWRGDMQLILIHTIRI